LKKNATIIQMIRTGLWPGAPAVHRCRAWTGLLLWY